MTKVKEEAIKQLYGSSSRFISPETLRTLLALAK